MSHNLERKEGNHQPGKIGSIRCIVTQCGVLPIELCGYLQQDPENISQSLFLEKFESVCRVKGGMLDMKVNVERIL